MTVSTRAIDTNDDTEFDLERSWTAPTSDLDRLLEEALKAIEAWKTRREGEPNPNAERYNADGTKLG